jgi:hypothetical protein
MLWCGFCLHPWARVDASKSPSAAALGRLGDERALAEHRLEAQDCWQAPKVLRELDV